MILEKVPYIRVTNEISAPAASLGMLVGASIDIKPYDVASVYEQSFTSMGFSRWLTSERGVNLSAGTCVVACMEYAIKDILGEKISISEIPTTIDTVYGSYTRRLIPVLMYGNFPSCSGHSLPNAVVIIGRVGDYLIVNDPIGNANTGYVSFCGERVLYSIDDLKSWTGLDIHAVRVILS